MQLFILMVERSDSVSLFPNFNVIRRNCERTNEGFAAAANEEIFQWKVQVSKICFLYECQSIIRQKVVDSDERRAETVLPNVDDDEDINDDDDDDDDDVLKWNIRLEQNNTFGPYP